MYGTMYGVGQGVVVWDGPGWCGISCTFAYSTRDRAAGGQFIQETTGFSIAGPGQIDQPKENYSKIEVWGPGNSLDR